MAFIKRPSMRNLKIGIANQITSTINYLPTLAESVRKDVLPTVLVALGETLSIANRVEFQSPINIAGRFAVAERYAQLITAGTGTTVVTDDDRNATTFGELTAVWSLPQDQSEIDSKQALRRILNKLRDNPPPISEVNNVIKIAFNTIKSSLDENNVEADVVIDVLGIENPQFQTYRRDWFDAHRMRLHWFLVAGQDENNLFFKYMSLIGPQSASQTLIPIGDQAPTIEYPAFSTMWKNATEDEILGYYELLAECEPVRIYNTAVSAVFTSVVYMCKDLNVTNMWMTRRIEQFAKEVGVSTTSIRVSSNTLNAYGFKYPKDNITNSIATNMMYGFNQLSSAIGNNALKWMIEQAACSQITMPLAFARAVTIKGFVNVDIIADRIPDEQWAKYAELVGWLLRDRFCSIITPPVQSKEIADIAYLGNGMIMKYEKRELYQGNQAMNIINRKQELDSIINHCYEISLSAQNDSSYLKTILQKNAKDFFDDEIDEINTEESDGYVYYIPKNMTKETPTTGGAAAQAETTVDQEPVYKTTNKTYKIRTPATKMDWPSQYKKNELVQRIELSALISKFPEKLSNKAKAIIWMSQKLISVAEQIKLAPIPEGSYRAEILYKAVPPEYNAHAATLQFNVPADWLTNTPNPAITDKDLRYTSFYKLCRERIDQQDVHVPPPPPPRPATLTEIVASYELDADSAGMVLGALQTIFTDDNHATTFGAVKQNVALYQAIDNLVEDSTHVRIRTKRSFDIYRARYSRDIANTTFWACIYKDWSADDIRAILSVLAQLEQDGS